MSGVIFFEAVSKAATNKNKDHQGDSQLELLTIFFCMGERRVINPPKLSLSTIRGGSFALQMS